MTSLALESVTVRLGQVVALRDVSLTLAAGARLAVVGASGSGKSTLLRAIVGLVRADEGTISIDDRVVTGPATFVPAHRRQVGYVPQDGALFPHLTVARNIGFGVPDRASRSRLVQEMTELVALEPELLARYPHELSGGQQQRVALARALAARPHTIVLDEPFSALDTSLRAQARNAVIRVLEASGVTAVLVTHDQDEALSFGSAVGVLDRGQLVQAGTPRALFDDPNTPAIAAFFADACFLPAIVTGNMATTAFGQVRVRRQHAADTGVARIMVRPNQFAIDATSPSPNARVHQVTWAGSSSHVVLRPTNGDEQLTIELSTRDASALEVGNLVTASVVGTVVAYSPAPAGRDHRAEGLAVVDDQEHPTHNVDRAGRSVPVA
ncbi:MAG TPA: ABC transporter ATP-binding protein [Propionicimonas sp.]|jgi:iron(III) transport system ATP-binding protein